MEPERLAIKLADFRRCCAGAGLAATHQRLVLYRVLVESSDHPSPEDIYKRVRQEIPSISPATVYKNIHTFEELGLLSSVGRFEQKARLDANVDHHHHLVCVQCNCIVDLYDERLDSAEAVDPAPYGFRIFDYRVEARGLCPDCQAKPQA